jgi:pyruvate dehydrogenase E2 component (dihydrolipoamide acetyltransferase)
MATPVIMPRQGQSVESCIITQWFKQKGDEVNVDELLFAYETDKASFEETAKIKGTLLEVFYREGDEVPVLVNVAVIGDLGEDAQSFKPLAKSVKQPLEGIQQEAVAEVTQEIDYPTKGIQSSHSVSPRAKREAALLGIDLRLIQGSGPNGRLISRDVQAAKETPRLSKLAQQIANESGYVALQGSGIGGRALQSDLVATTQPTDEYTDTKLSNVRKIIAKSMHESLQNSAQLTHHMSADVTKFLAFRKTNKSQDGSNPLSQITLNDLVCYAVVKALVKHPAANSHFLGNQIRTFAKVHLGLAVDTPRGLMVPVIKNTSDMNLTELSNQMKSIAESCRNGSINPDLLSATAASFTVSNLGAYGVEIFTPVINLPQVAILGICTIIYRPVDKGDGSFDFCPFMGLSLTYDHRALDGGPATLFLKEIKNEIENFNL